METKEIRDEMPTDATQQLNTGRRNFIKSTSLALPAIVTLQSGTALAATSYGCGGNGNISQTYAQVLVDGYPPSDNRLRGKVTLCRALTYSKSKKEWSVSTGNAGSYFLGKDSTGDCWRYLDGKPVLDGSKAEEKFLTAVKMAAMNDPRIKNCASFKTTNVKYAIAHVSVSDGSVVAIGHPDPKNPPMNAMCTSWTGACLASIYGHKPKW